MKRLLFAVLGLVLGLSTGVNAQSANLQNFAIESFSGDYRLSKDSRGTAQLQVIETIVAIFPEFDQNHGILRSIPETYKGQPLNPQIISITDGEDRPHPFTTYRENDNLVLRIGDADTFVHGHMRYVISYNLSNVISFPGEHDEFYWDINGDEWSQPFGVVKAKIHIPDSLVPSLQERSRCFSGAFGATETNCQAQRQVVRDGIEIDFEARDLAPGENLSVVLAFNRGTFFEDPWPARKRLLLAASAVMPPAIIVWYGFRRWRRIGRDYPSRGVIIPQYAPPNDLNVLGADVVLNERLRRNALSAALIDLAVRGYLKITETKKKKLISSTDEYQLELLKDIDDLPDSERQLLKGLFDKGQAGETVSLADKANKLSGTYEALSRSVPKGLAKRRYFAVDPNKARSNWLIRGVIIMLAGLALVFFDLTRFLGFGLMFGGGIFMMFAPAMPARSRLGVESKDHLEGLKDYIKLAEADRIKFLQSPEGVKQYGDPTQPQNQIKLFEKLLPYAMLFGLEKDWAKEFKHLYESPPDWYHTYRSDFTPAVLADSLSSSFSAGAAKAFTSPQSSGSSGFSSGGGFSGGGGGGGGGGGW